LDGKRAGPYRVVIFGPVQGSMYLASTVQYLERSILLLIILASDLLIRTITRS